ncbi:uncharacterized protein LOC111329956 [Stylophora pistillata]|uniref:P2X purinoreceptor 7 intracellular domain-containing protein n=1 Tax=Stylophora pistillata TaxID=50429 RepID=A0A2B4S9G3_STYPI|nr:uncharacterized protein LOC111329956 [Stylophora pistillata]PFX25739.1 hypothetical protein AWC38_SpisGene9618 [Stylophora pistillata]
MSSDSDSSSESCGSSERMDWEHSESSDSEAIRIDGVIVPYQDEPLADCIEEESSNASEETDNDGLSPSTLEARFEGNACVDSWCQCEQCNNELLVGALEFRCCREVTNSSAKMLFDGSIERIKCITEHEDYDAITNRAVLLQVAPLLRNQDGGIYRRRNGVSENEFIRAVAYRWITRWLCGYIGRDNRRPLPACVYHSKRKKYNTRQHKGYANFQEH